VKVLSSPVSAPAYIVFQTGPLQASRYNFHVPPDDSSARGLLLYNSLSGAAAELDQAETEIFNRFEAGKPPGAMDLLRHLPQIDTLYGNGFLVEAGADEPGRVMAERLYWRKNRHHVDITLVPTLACNFACIYCFENRNTRSFSREDRETAIEFCRKAIEPGARTVLLHWYGGEPTLRVKDIQAIAPAVYAHTEEVGALFHSEIFTNAWLLDDQMCRTLAQDCRIRTMQISLDGPPDIHNGMRRGPDGIGDYASTMDRLWIALRYFDIKLRIHCHTDNEHRLPELVDDLQTRGFHQAEQRCGNYLHLHFSKLYDFTDACKHIREIRLDQHHFGEFQCDMMEYAQQRGFRVNWLPKRVLGKYCNNQREAAWIFVPGGNLYKCYRHDFSQAEGLAGSAADRLIPLQVTPKVDATDLSECHECIYLPLCSGTCPETAWSETRCTHLKGNVERRLLSLHARGPERESLFPDSE